MSGPDAWEHRFVTANGSRFHVVVATPPGEAPPRPGASFVVLLHGFPRDWWAWRHQLASLSAAGYRVAALDLRGAGGSDKPPRGYDTPTLAADVGGVVRALGEPDAVVVGHGTGGHLAWSMPALEPQTTRAVAVLSSPHPLRRTPAGSWVSRRHVLGMQVPVLPERRLRDGRLVRDLLQRWGGPGWPSPEEAEHAVAAMRVPLAAHSAAEHVRWLVRSRVRRDGRTFRRGVDVPVDVPVLQLHGELDGLCTPAAARPAGRLAPHRHRFEVVTGAGHFLPEEVPGRVDELLLAWLAALR